MTDNLSPAGAGGPDRFGGADDGLKKTLSGSGIRVILEPSDCMPLNYFTYGKAFTGSLKNLRYRMIRRMEKEGDQELPWLEVCIWPGPFAYGKTAEELKLRGKYPFTEEGRLEAIGWINEMVQKSEGLPEALSSASMP